MIKVSQIYNAVDGTRQDFEVTFPAGAFDIKEISGEVTARGYIMRVDEGVMMLVNELEATQLTPCALCGKELKRKLNFTPSEWLFYEKKPLREDDENESLTLDRTRMEIDPFSPIRQDIILNIDYAPRCTKPCKHYEEPEDGIKALAGLKDLFKKGKK
jgi:uncharacterized metal-binding protein YceD (DUF177 family)